MAEKRVHAKTTRCERGIALFREKRGEIERIAAFTYRVPSCSDKAVYTVILDLGYCSCPDHPRAKDLGDVCKHVYCAVIASAKHRAELAQAGK